MKLLTDDVLLNLPNFSKAKLSFLIHWFHNLSTNVEYFIVKRFNDPVVDIYLKSIVLCLYLQHPYVYGVLVFEAMATFIGQVSVLSLIALFGAATTALVNL